MECVQRGQAHPHLRDRVGSRRRAESTSQILSLERSRDARDLTPGDYDAPPFSLGGQDDYAFSPDGQEICYTSNHDKVEATSTNNDLWIVPVNGGTTAPVAAKNITADNPASDSTPLYSPDGKYIAYRAQQRPGYESDRFRLMLYDRKTGEKKNLTEDFDRLGGNVCLGTGFDRHFFHCRGAGRISDLIDDRPLNHADAESRLRVVHGIQR